ncbi:MAG: aldolase/citrate lyase family protein [Candidatus Muiribacteriaceae bacterium]
MSFRKTEIDLKQELRERLFELRDTYGACSLKMGTEAESNTFEEIRYMHETVSDILPVIVKVGGCEARNDIRKMSEIGVRGIVGPMIDSPYSLKLFVKTLRDFYPDTGSVFKVVNVESITSFENLGRILNSPDFDIIDQVTVGRSDFSASIGTYVDDEKVYDYVREIVNAAHRAGKITSVGGGITPKNAMRIKEYTGTEKVNIRTVVIDLNKCSDLYNAIKNSLELEILILELNTQLYPVYSEYFTERIRVIRDRIAC